MKATSANTKCSMVDCGNTIPNSRFACRLHWSMVTDAMQKAIWRAYREGQRTGTHPSPGWWRAAGKAIEHVAKLEGKNTAKGRIFQEFADEASKAKL